MMNPNERDYIRSHQQRIIQQAEQDRLAEIARKNSSHRQRLRLYQVLMVSLGHWLIRSGYSLAKHYSGRADLHLKIIQRPDGGREILVVS